jgi:enamine deaminase RidA (YjgF/YER057c/UK114 family)
VCGCVGVDKHGNTLGDGTIETQTDGAYESISAVLAEAGATLDDLVMTRVYLTKPEDFEPYKKARQKHLREKGPGQTVIIAKALGRADLLVEIEAIAVVDG